MMCGNFHSFNLGIKTVSILDMKGKEFQLKLDVVEEIFNSVQNEPVAIISVAGALRGGKSFILNMLLHYLLESGNGSINKMWQEKDRKIINAFKSRNGTKRETVGIDITTKPIMLLDKNGQKVAVFLMDSEGLFDKERNAKHCSTLFAMSCLLSSLQVYNIAQRLDESHLQNLQALMFLIRDWANRDYECSSKSAENYLENFLKSDTEENQLIRQQIKSSFSDVRCHLLPRPGDEVESKDGDELLISDVKERFLQGVESLGEQLFKQENITAKKLNGIAITGQGFVDLAVTYANILQTGKMPPAETIVKANRILFIYNLARHLEQEYDDAMEKKIGGKYIKPNRLEELHKQCKEHVVQQYDDENRSDILDEKDIQALTDSIKQIMITGIEKSFQALQSINKAKEKDQVMAIKALCDDAGKLYKEELKQAANGQYLENFSQQMKNAEQRAFKDFYDSSQDYDEDLVKKCENMVRDVIYLKHNQFEEKNKKRKETLEQNLNGLVSEVEIKYVQMMDKVVEEAGKGLNFHQLKLEAVEQAVQMFEASDVGKGFKCRPEKLDMLRKRFDQIGVKYEERFLRYRNEKLAVIVKTTEDAYKRNIGQFTHNMYLEEKEITNRHEMAVKAAMKVVKNVQCDRMFIQECKHCIREKMKDQLALLQRNNDVFRKEKNLEFQNHRKTLVTNHIVKAFQKSEQKYIEDIELENNLGNARTDVIQRYLELQSPPEKEFNKNKDMLEADICKKTMKIIQNNNKHKEGILERIDTFYDLLMADYIILIKKITSDRYANKDNLQILHNNYKHLVGHEMGNAIPYETIRKEAVKKCEAHLDVQFRKLVDECTKWKSIRENVLSCAGTGALLGAGLMGLLGAGLAGLAGGVVGGVTGLAKAAMKFEHDISIVEWPSIQYLRSIEL
ncbi:uncharacterized protein LOC144749666 isoform X2 [Ciona intestinalis]